MLARPKLLAALALLLAAALGSCGAEDPEPGRPGAMSRDQWVAQVMPLCSDGVQEATALPLPSRPVGIARDAAARAEIVATVRDGILGLGAPEGEADAVDAYLAELAADIELLRAIERAAAAGDDYRELSALLDESAGRAALELDLEDCAAFANAIARTP